MLCERATGPLVRKMEDLDKRKVYALIQQSIQKVSNEKIQIVSFAQYYVVDGTSGVKFTAKKGDVELKFFAGFSSDKKYSEKLLFGILKSESNENIEKLKLDKDENGNNIQEKFSIDEKFLSADEEIRKSKLTKWLSDQITTVFSLYGVYNFSYSNLGFLRWFIFIELPWIILLSTAAYVCLLENIKDDVTYFPLSCKILCSVAFLLILCTLRLKNKIRKARNKRITLNPWSWGVSYIAKTVFFITFFPILLIPYFLKLLKLPFLPIYSILTAEVSSSNSSSSSSSANSSPTGKRTSWSNKASKLYWYTCSNCGLAIKNNQSPSRNVCSNSTFHYWHNVGEVGDNNYCCKHCGVTIQTKQSPFRIGCPNSSFHNWHKL